MTYPGSFQQRAKGIENRLPARQNSQRLRGGRQRSCPEDPAKKCSEKIKKQPANALVKAWGRERNSIQTLAHALRRNE